MDGFLDVILISTLIFGAAAIFLWALFSDGGDDGQASEPKKEEEAKGISPVPLLFFGWWYHNSK